MKKFLLCWTQARAAVINLTKIFVVCMTRNLNKILKYQERQMSPHVADCEGLSSIAENAGLVGCVLCCW